jgi:hypothetical protein
MRILEALANIAIVCVASLVGFVVVRDHVLARPPAAAAHRGQVTAGSRVDAVPTPAAGSRTLVMALQTTCHFCSESAPFYRELTKAAAGHGVHLVAVLPQPIDQSREYLAGMGIEGVDVQQRTLPSVGVLGTPTLILVNDKGVATKVWVGKLPEAAEQEVYAALSRS